jgi:hypothetical protein
MTDILTLMTDIEGMARIIRLAVGVRLLPSVIVAGISATAGDRRLISTGTAASEFREWIVLADQASQFGQRIALSVTSLTATVLIGRAGARTAPRRIAGTMRSVGVIRHAWIPLLLYCASPAHSPKSTPSCVADSPTAE